MSTAMTRKAWLEYLQKAVDEFDWETAGKVQATWDNNLQDALALLRQAHDMLSLTSLPEGFKRRWVGLTDGEIAELWDETVKYVPSEIRIKDFARAIEAKLKEKNNAN